MTSDSPVEYKRVLIYKDIDIEVVIIEWPPGAETPWHDHGEAKGTVTVLDGRIKEMVRDKKTKGSLRTIFRSRGDTFFETTDTIHKMKNISPVQTAFTLHVYTSKLEMKEYAEDELKK